MHLKETRDMTDRSSTGDRIQGTIDETKGKAKQAWGDATDNPQTQAEGMADEAKGKAEKAWGNIKDAASDVADDLSDATR
jgi:uncharacterized protein YjbJ (UPF0337 family)